MANKVVPVFSFASFDEYEFMLLKIRAADADKLHDTYADWRADLDRIKREAQAKGVEVQEIPMTVLELDDYCLLNDCPLDGKARAAFAAEKARALDQEKPK